MVSYPVCVSQGVELRQRLLCLQFILPKLLQHLLVQEKVKEWWPQGLWAPAGLSIWGHLLTNRLLFHQLETGQVGILAKALGSERS